MRALSFRRGLRQIQRMKSPQRFAVLALAAAVLAPLSASADVATEMLKEARAAFASGDLNTAKAKLETVRSVDPKNPAAAALLKQILIQQSGGGGTEAMLSRVIVPKVEFKDAQLTAVLGALRQQGERLTGGKIVPNFVAQLPEEQANQPITLNLSNIPYTEVLKYVGSLANVSFTYDKYAILVKPAGAAKTVPAPAPVEAAK